MRAPATWRRGSRRRARPRPPASSARSARAAARSRRRRSAARPRSAPRRRAAGRSPGAPARSGRGRRVRRGRGRSRTGCANSPCRCDSAYACQRCPSGSTSSVSGTGAITPSGPTYDCHAPEVMNARDRLPRDGEQRHRQQRQQRDRERRPPQPDPARCRTPRARRPCTPAGCRSPAPTTRASRAGSAALKTGSAASSAYGSGMSVMFPKILMRGPQRQHREHDRGRRRAPSGSRAARDRTRPPQQHDADDGEHAAAAGRRTSSPRSGWAPATVSSPATPASERSGNAPYAAMSSAWIRGSKPVPWKRCGPKKCSHSGYASRTAATTAVTAEPAQHRRRRPPAPRPGGPGRAPRPPGTPRSASAVKNSPSAAMENATATSTPRITPPRTACPGVRSAKTRQSSSGTSQPAVQLRCALACETMPGAKPMNSPPSAAAAVDATRCRESSQYQAYAVAARLRVRITRNVAGGADQVRQRGEHDRVHGDRGVDARGWPRPAR